MRSSLGTPAEHFLVHHRDAEDFAEGPPTNKPALSMTWSTSFGNTLSKSLGFRCFRSRRYRRGAFAYPIFAVNREHDFLRQVFSDAFFMAAPP